MHIKRACVCIKQQDLLLIFICAHRAALASSTWASGRTNQSPSRSSSLTRIPKRTYTYLRLCARVCECVRARACVSALVAFIFFLTIIDTQKNVGRTPHGTAHYDLAGSSERGFAEGILCGSLLSCNGVCSMRWPLPGIDYETWTCTYTHSYCLVMEYDPCGDLYQVINYEKTLKHIHIYSQCLNIYGDMIITHTYIHSHAHV